jgi:polyisoprenyl-phosphate glycosyltransferase
VTTTLISFVVPVFNEQDNIRPLHERVTRVMASLADRYDYELLFTDNHSTDDSPRVLEELARSDSRVRAIRFSRNFGYQRSILTGYLAARGACAIQLDCDLQDPPELVPRMLDLWRAGNAVVYGIRRSRREGVLITAVRRVFYWLIDWLSEDELPRDAGDFRLVDRRVLEVLRKYEDAHPYLRGTIAAMGFDQVGFEYDRAERTRGETKFSFSALMRLAIDGILNHSIVPLRLATFTGLAVSVVTFVALIGYMISKVFFGAQWPAGFATLATLQLLGLSLNAMFLGIIGEYLGRVYQQVKRRPLTVVEGEWEFPAQSTSEHQPPRVLHTDGVG